jgi:ribose transport system substrate-binding protein
LHIPILEQNWADMEATANRDGTGVKIVVVDAGGNTGTEIQDAQNFVAQGFNAIHINAISPAGWEPVVQSALSHHMVVFNHSADAINNTDQNMVVDHYDAGFGVGKVAAQFINSKLGGKTGVGVVADLASSLLLRSKGFAAAIKQYAPHATVYPFANINLGTPTQAASAVSNLLQAHPDIHVIFSYLDDFDPAIEQAMKEVGKTDRNQYFLGSTDGASPQIEQVKQGDSVLQADGSFFFRPDAVIDQRDIEKAMCGKKVPPTRTIGAYTVTQANASQAIKEANDLFGTESANLFHYYSKPLVTGGPVPRG